MILRCSAVLLLLAACQGYEPAPLDPQAVFAEVEQRRQAPDADTDAQLTLARLRRWLHEHAPALREAVAAYAAELAVAGIATPWPNPLVDVGVDLASGPAALVNETAPQVGLILRIPLGGRLGAADDLNLARAEAARLHALEVLRALEVDLLARYGTLAFARRERALAQELAAIAAATAELARRMVAAGELGALDLGMFELAAARAAGDVLTTKAHAAEAAAALAQLLGVATARLEAELAEPPAAPAAVAALAELRAQMIEAHPLLARLRAEYAVAEQQLRLEVAQQYPDLALGATYGDDAGDDKTVLGLRLGLELPLFDRNQQAIARAERQRQSVRVRYEAEANRALAELERTHQRCSLTLEQRDWMAHTLLPQALHQTELARQALATGAFGALQLAQAQRTERELRRELLAAERTAWLAWVGLERATGAPLEGESTGSPAAIHAPARERLQQENSR